MTHILTDNRWSGAHGIGRFSEELNHRLQADKLQDGPSPLSIKNLYWLPRHLHKVRHQYQVYFSPGFMPPLHSAIPFVFTIHDLIHIYGPQAFNMKHHFMYQMIKRIAKKAHKIITVSEYSKQQIQEWSGIPADKITVIYNGISSLFTSIGPIYLPGFSYILNVGNMKPHKNIPRLIRAFKQANIDKSIKLILTGQVTSEISQLIQQYQLTERVIFSGPLQESELAAYYRGALALVAPSLYEGFGLPIIEAMASGIPVLTSNATSLPEVAGDAAIMVNPLDVEALQFHIEQLIENQALRNNLIARGLKRVTYFSWDKSATLLQEVLSQI